MLQKQQKLKCTGSIANSEFWTCRVVYSEVSKTPQIQQNPFDSTMNTQFLIECRSSGVT